MRVIAGTARRLNLVTAPGLQTRPTTDRIKETLFNILQPEIPGCRFLDLFAGSGGIGIEALSRGAKEAVFVENNRKAAACIQQNLSFTHLSEQARVLETDVLTALARLEREGQAFSVIFLDPPYDKGWEQKVFSFLHDSCLTDEDTLIVVEESNETDFSFAGEYGFSIVREKCYKTNKHVFLKRGEGSHHA
ncbi:16S rRNA (guanine(966)-N(2))-methyltransferase RsmD [Hominifimenecus sp. rT4P-3]|uniref:16S rRNA (guanine(966)-N(2))-methyltransferase RsmD n=1 Tax=Hominifimenecus sp. rT4P-3 TaxID=3242979 RepID=UPI003DA4AACE